MSSDSEAALERARVLLDDLERAVLRLGAALSEPENEFIRDAAIQRFEFSFELAWKSIRVSAKLEGQDCASPRMAISTAWSNGWISDEAAWLDMLEESEKSHKSPRLKSRVISFVKDLHQFGKNFAAQDVLARLEVNQHADRRLPLQTYAQSSKAAT